MTSINTIIAGSSSYAIGLDNYINFQGAQGVARPEPNQATGEVVFEQGQWWKNKVGASNGVQSTEAGKCGCQACSACAAQAYQAQSSLTVQAPPNPQETPEQVLYDKGQPEKQPANSPDSEIDQHPSQEDGQATTEAVKRPDGQSLNQEEKLELAKLQQIDTAIRAHEMAHLAAAGPYAKSGASFQYKRGPDGKNYAVAGEVQIDTSMEPTPEATIRKMRMVRAAALAPVDPSPQDRKVAASATSAISSAIQELQILKREEVEAEGRQKVVEIERAKEGSSGENSAIQDRQKASEDTGGTITIDYQQINQQRPFATQTAAMQRINAAQYQHPGLSIRV